MPRTARPSGAFAASPNVSYLTAFQCTRWSCKNTFVGRMRFHFIFGHMKQFSFNKMNQDCYFYCSALKDVRWSNSARQSVHVEQKKSHLRRVATSLNGVLRTTAALSPPVEMKLLQSVGVIQRAPLDHCGGWGNVFEKILIFKACSEPANQLRPFTQSCNTRSPSQQIHQRVSETRASRWDTNSKSCAKGKRQCGYYRVMLV